MNSKMKKKGDEDPNDKIARKLMFSFNNHKLTSCQDGTKTFVEWDERQVSNLEIASISVDQLLKTIKRHRVIPTLVLLKNVVDAKTTPQILAALYVLFCQIYTGTSYQLVMSLVEHAPSIASLCSLAYTALTDPSNTEFVKKINTLTTELDEVKTHVDLVHQQSPDLGDFDHTDLPPVLQFLQNHDVIVKMIFGAMAMIATCFGISFCAKFAVFQQTLGSLSTFAKSIRDGKVVGKALDESTDSMMSALFTMAGSEYVPRHLQHVKRLATEVNDLYEKVQKFKTEVSVDYFSAMRDDQFYLLHNAIIDLQKRYMELTENEKSVSNFKDMLSYIFQYLSAMQDQRIALMRSQAGKQEPVCLYVAGAPGRGKTELLNRLCITLFREKKWTRYTRTFTDPFWSGYGGNPIFVGDDFGQMEDCSDHFEFLQCKNSSATDTIGAALEDKGKPFCSRVMILSSNQAYITSSLKVKDMEALNRRRDLLVIAKNLDYTAYVTSHPHAPPEEWWAKHPTTYMVFDPLRGLREKMSDLATADETHPFFVTNITERQMLDFVIEKEKYYAEQYRQRIIAIGNEVADKLTVPIKYDAEKFSIMAIKRNSLLNAAAATQLPPSVAGEFDDTESVSVDDEDFKSTAESGSTDSSMKLGTNWATLVQKQINTTKDVTKPTTPKVLKVDAEDLPQAITQPILRRSATIKMVNNDFLVKCVDEHLSKLPPTHNLHGTKVPKNSDIYHFLRRLPTNMIDSVARAYAINIEAEITLSKQGNLCPICKICHSHRQCLVPPGDYKVIEDVPWTTIKSDEVFEAAVKEIMNFRSTNQAKKTPKAETKPTVAKKLKRRSRSKVYEESLTTSSSAHSDLINQQAGKTFPVVVAACNPKRYAMGIVGLPGCGKTHAVRKLFQKQVCNYDWDTGSYDADEDDTNPSVLFDDITVSNERMEEFKEILSSYHEDDNDIKMIFFTANPASELWTQHNQELICRRSMVWEVKPSWGQSALSLAQSKSFSNFLMEQSDQYRDTSVMMYYHKCASEKAVNELEPNANVSKINFLAFEALLHRALKNKQLSLDRMNRAEAFSIPDFTHEVYVRFGQALSEVPKQNLSSLSTLAVYKCIDGKHRKISVLEYASYAPLLLRLLNSSAFGDSEEFVRIFNQELNPGTVPRVRVDFIDCTIAFMTVENNGIDVIMCALVEDQNIPVIINDNEVVLGGVSHEIDPENKIYAKALKVALGTNNWLPDMKIDVSDEALFSQTTRSTLYNLLRIIANVVEFAVMGLSLASLVMSHDKDEVKKEAAAPATDDSYGTNSNSPTTSIQVGNWRDHAQQPKFHADLPNTSWVNDGWKPKGKDWNDYDSEAKMLPAANLELSSDVMGSVSGIEWCVIINREPTYNMIPIDGDFFVDTDKKRIVIRIGHVKEIINIVAKYDIKRIHTVNSALANLKGLENVTVVCHTQRQSQPQPKQEANPIVIIPDNALVSRGHDFGISFRDRVVYCAPHPDGFVVDCVLQDGWRTEDYEGNVDERCLQLQIGNVIKSDYVHFPKVFAMFFLTNNTVINGFDYTKLLEQIFSQERRPPAKSNVSDNMVHTEGNVDANITKEIEYIKQNRVDMMVGETVYVHGIMLKKKIGLTVAHAVKKTTSVVTYRDGHPVSIKWLNEWPKHDLALFEITDAVTEFKDITRHFCTNQDLQNIMGSGLSDIPMCLSKVDCKERCQHVSYGCVDAVVKSSDSGGSYHAQLSSYMSTGISEPGYCGSLTAFVTPSAQRKFFGMHNAGSQTSSYFTFLTQERIIELINIMPEGAHVTAPTELGLRVAQGAFLYKKSYSLPSGGLVVGQIMDKIHIPENTKLYRTGLLFEEYDNTEPSVLSEEDPRVPGRSLFVESTAKYLQPGVTLSEEQKEKLRHCYKVIGQHVVSKLVVANKGVRVLTKSEAINGIQSAEFEHLKRMDGSGAVGWPYSKMDTRKEKREFLDVGEDGKRRFKKDPVAQKISNDTSLIIDDAKKGTKPVIPFVPYNKDEARDKSKTSGENAKTRTFWACNMAFMLAFRMFFQAAQCRLMEIRHEIAPKIGIAANERKDWTKLHIAMEKNAPKGIDMDAANWDSTMLGLELHWVNKYFYEPIYRKLDPFWTPEDAQVRKILHGVGEGAYVILFGKILKLTGKMISGFPGTSFGNSLALWCEMFYIWRELADEFAPHLKSFKSFQEHVCLAIFGDDNTLTIKPNVAVWFTFENIRRVGLTLGTKFTPSEKDKEVAEMVPLEKLTFLKRKFVSHGEQKMGVLSLASIMKPIHWVRDSPSYNFIGGARISNDKRKIADSLSVISYELSLHGKQVYCQTIGKVLQQCAKLAIPFEPPAWEEALELLGYIP